MQFLLLITCLLALIGCCISVGSPDDYCFGKDKERIQTRHFTSKTAYQIVKGTHLDKQYLVPGCEAKKMWIFHRHGTRLPAKSLIKKASRLEQLKDSIIKNYRVLRTAPQMNPLCNEDLIALQMWKWNASITVDMENFLTSQGYEDMRGTAKTYLKYYPEILAKEYNHSYFLFRHTDTQRTTESFKAFAEGLFGPNNVAIAEDIPAKDLLLLPYDHCHSWEHQDYQGPNSESGKYRGSAIWNQTMAEISSRLGFQYTLENDDIQAMFDICRYEQAWQVDRTSVWCAAFLPHHVSVFEYEDDLKYFYKAGYGIDDNSRLNCRAVQDMARHLSSPEMPNVISYFGHSIGLQTLLTALGINKDDIPMKADNYAQLADRKWKTSNIDPFASNFVAVKYQCDSDPLEKERVIFFLNQNAVHLDWCQVGLCRWSEVKTRYSSLLNADCDSYYCADAGATATMNVSLFSLMVAALVYLINLM